MKNLLTLVIIQSWLMASTIYLNGFGEQIKANDPASISLGNSILFSARNDGTAVGAMSSEWQSRKTRIQMINSFSYFNIDGESNYSNHRFNLLRFLVPVRNKFAFSIGLSPYTRSQFEVTDIGYSFVPGDTLVDPLAYNNRYDVSGGISDFTLGLSWGISGKISTGIKWRNLFGNHYSEEEVYTYEMNFNSTGEVDYVMLDSAITNHSVNFHGSSFDIDGRIEFGNSNLAFITSIDGPLELKKYSENNNVSMSDTQINEKTFFINSVGFGYQHISNDVWGKSLEFHQKFKANISPGIKKYLILEQIGPQWFSMHLGTFYQFRSSKTIFWNQFSVCTGFMYKQVNFDVRTVNDYSFSIGMGIEFINFTNSLDISLIGGKRQSDVSGFPEENYLKINLGLTSRDTWFVKRRRK